jgi:hypothetical protein
MALIYGEVERNAFTRLGEEFERRSIREQRRKEILNQRRSHEKTSAMIFSTNRVAWNRNLATSPSSNARSELWRV